jgi:hypothetical protein
MKTSFFTRFSCLTTLALGLAVGSANADPINITVNAAGTALVSYVPFSDLGNNGDATVFTWLKTDVTAYNALEGASLPTPTAMDSNGTPFVKLDRPPSTTITLGGYDYLVLHWGGQVGAFQIYDVTGISGDFTVPSPGGPPTIGGLSSYAFYGSGGNPVPDGGTTLVLLGLALVGLSVFRRKALNAA